MTMSFVLNINDYSSIFYHAEILITS